MKATGIVRRIDDLGRVVIPKEIRRTMRIREGDPLEIYTDADGEVIFKKYSPIGELSSFTGQYAEVLSRSTNLPVLICDRDHVIACAGIPKREAVDRRISANLESLMEKRSNFVYSGSGESLRPVEGLERMAGIAYPHCVEGITANVARCKTEAQESIALSTVVAATFGYPEDVRVAHYRAEKGCDVKQAVIELKLMTPEQANVLVDPLLMAEPEKMATIVARFKKELGILI